MNATDRTTKPPKLAYDIYALDIDIDNLARMTRAAEFLQTNACGDEGIEESTRLLVEKAAEMAKDLNEKFEENMYSLGRLDAGEGSASRIALGQTAALLALDAEVDALGREIKALNVALAAGDQVIEDVSAKIEALDERRQAIVAKLNTLKRGEEPQQRFVVLAGVEGGFRVALFVWDVTAVTAFVESDCIGQWSLGVSIESPKWTRSFAPRRTRQYCAGRLSPVSALSHSRRLTVTRSFSCSMRSRRSVRIASNFCSGIAAYFRAVGRERWGRSCGSYFMRSLRSVLDRLKAAAIEFASIAMLVAGFIRVALFAVDLLDVR
jgi:hypothetical protein